ncbi:MAG TPA: hypothetical protein ENF21_02010 [Bacteroidetes bacterium]|nr:hypothetical protein [Bacteroidota bacterium]
MDREDKIRQQDKELTDSIRYAGLIQTAVLPTRDYLTNILPPHFIFFQPKDIVSGDFYWATRLGKKTYVAAADCTGHGVPGAFMSIMGISFLNEIVNQKIPLKTGRILNQLREKVMKALHQKGDSKEPKDGMDIALIMLDPENSLIEFSGAFNALYLIRDDKLQVIRGDRMPIGVNAVEERSFQTHVIQVQEGDCLYIFTDGFPDQFGGPEDKKYKYGPFQKFLLSIHKEDMEQQKWLLINEMLEWKGDNEQIDDILVIGIRIE